MCGVVLFCVGVCVMVCVVLCVVVCFVCRCVSLYCGLGLVGLSCACVLCCVCNVMFVLIGVSSCVVVSVLYCHVLLYIVYRVLFCFNM